MGGTNHALPVPLLVTRVRTHVPARLVELGLYLVHSLLAHLLPIPLDARQLRIERVHLLAQRCQLRGQLGVRRLVLQGADLIAQLRVLGFLLGEGVAQSGFFGGEGIEQGGIRGVAVVLQRGKQQASAKQSSEPGKGSASHICSWTFPSPLFALLLFPLSILSLVPYLLREVHSGLLEVLRLQHPLLRELVQDADERRLLDALVQVLVHDQGGVGAILLGQQGGTGHGEQSKASKRRGTRVSQREMQHRRQLTTPGAAHRHVQRANCSSWATLSTQLPPGSLSAALPAVRRPRLPFSVRSSSPLTPPLPHLNHVLRHLLLGVIEGGSFGFLGAGATISTTGL